MANVMGKYHTYNKYPTCYISSLKRNITLHMYNSCAERWANKYFCLFRIIGREGPFKFSLEPIYDHGQYRKFRPQ